MDFGCVSLASLPNGTTLLRTPFAKDVGVCSFSRSNSALVRLPASRGFGRRNPSSLFDGDFGRVALRRRHETAILRVVKSAKLGSPVAEVIKDDGVKWWQKEAPPNFKEISSTEEFITALSSAGERLVIIEFFGSWCGSCKALYPKLCKIAESRPDIDFYKINFDLNKPLCKRLNIRVLPYFHFYRGADGRLDAFSASISKLQRLKDAIEIHGTERCSLGPPVGVGDLDLVGPANPPSTPTTAT